MHEHVSGISGRYMEQDDLTYILPLVQQTLKTTLSFETLHYLPLNHNALQDTADETDIANTIFVCTKLFGLSERQQKRLKEALSAKQPFLDAIGHNVFLPICIGTGLQPTPTTSNIHGILAIKGINRLINIEEMGRWRQLLQHHIQLLVQNILQQTLISQKDDDGAVYPPFLQLFLKKIQTDGTCTAIVHVSQIHCPSEQERDVTTYNTTDFYTKARTVCLRLWPSVRLKYLGGNRVEAWFAILNKDHSTENSQRPSLKYDALASGLKRFWQSVPSGVAKNLSLYLHFDKNTCLSLPFILQTESLARQLGAYIFSNMDMALLQQRMGAQYLSEALQLIALLPDRIKAAAFISSNSEHEINIKKIKTYLPDFLQLIPTSHKNAFIISHTETGDSFVKHIEKAIMAIPELEHTTMGIAFDDATLKAANISSPAAAAIYAYLHASLLSESHSIFLKKDQNTQRQAIKKAVFDALTLHVAGDELFAMGDMNAACKMFQKALALALRQNRRHRKEQKTPISVVTPSLLNSLGITLLQTGRRAAAVRYFNQALEQFPEDVMAYYNLSEILLETKQLDKAEELLRKAAQLAPEDMHITIKLANCLFEKQDTNAAIGLLAPFMTKGQAELPATFFKLQGKLGLEKGNWSHAKEHLNKALVRTPYDAEILFFLAKGYLFIENDPKTARRLLKQAELLTSSKKLHKMIVDLKRKTEKMP